MTMNCGFRYLLSVLAFVLTIRCEKYEVKKVKDICTDYGYIPEPTVVPYEPFSPSQDAFLLRNATKDSGTDEMAIIKLVTKRSNAQRQVIMKRYFDDYNRDLILDLKSELSSELKSIIVNLMYPPLGFLCLELNRALNTLPLIKDTNTITEIVITKNSTELIELNKMYMKMFNRVLVNEVGSLRSSSSHYKNFGFRQPENATDPAQAKQQASLLYVAGEGRRGTEESLINKVMGHESYEQLKLVFREYKNQFGRTVEQSFRKELSGDLLRIHLAIVDFIHNPIAYYTKQLYRSMRGPGTDDATLMRILISRSEIDLENIKREFERRYERTLKSAIEADTYGYYKDALLSILG
ncbi:hypothetical protein M8J75_002657 [Diaphorina citri]|nr:hypothetical protein M8J75_002657 [Diaphorina citri]